MALVQFPTSPTLNQTYTVGSKTWKWNGYAWDLVLTTTPNTAFNIYGGSANQIHYQTGANTTSFITAPSNGTFLYYTTAGGFQWTAVTSASVGTANIATYSTITNATTGTYYPTIVSATSGNLQEYSNSAFIFNAATGALTATSFSGAGTGLTGTASSLNIGGNAGTVSSISYGQVTTALNYVPSQTAISSNTNSLISADTRSINRASNTYNSFGLYQDFKGSATVGIGSGSYSGVLTIAPWNDDSGGGNHQLAFTDQGTMLYRYGTRTSNWGTWYTNIHSGNYTNYSIPSSGGTFSGSVTITGDLSVTGNTIFSGNTEYVNVTNLRVSDPVIYLGANNYSSDLVSIGFVGNYFNGANQLHTGLFRAPTTNNYYLFTGVRDELDNVNVISTSANGWMLATLNANISGPSITATGQFSGPGTGLTGTAASLTVGTATTATNISGGSANQIHYQTGAGATSFITAPSNGTFLYYTTAGGFSWQASTAASVGTANIANYEVVTNATTGTYYPAFYNNTSGNLAVYANNAFVVDAASGALAASSFVSSRGISDTSGTGTQIRITNPGGASNGTIIASITGAIKIKLPVAGNNSSTMMNMRVVIYDYQGGGSGTSRTLEIGGYNYSLGSWYNYFATQQTMGGSDINVRFGQDATGDCIWIGDTTSTWSYPKVYVTEFQAGQSFNTAAIWGNGWNISWVTSFDTVEAGPIVAGKPLTSQNYTSYALGTSGGTSTGQLISTYATTTSTGGGSIYLNGTNSRLDFNTSGVNPPSFTNISSGTKLVLYPSISGSSVDYAFGIENNTLWSSVPSAASQFKWYAGTTNIATLSGVGVLSLAGVTLSTTNPTAASGVVPSMATMNGGRTYTNYDLNGQPLLFETRFVNIAGSSNVTSGMSGMGYWFGMGAGDTTPRGFSLMGTSGSGMWYKEHTSGTSWTRVLDSSNYTNYLVANTGGTYTGQIISTYGATSSTGGGNYYLNGSNNRIDFNTSGINPPTYSTISSGTKLVLYPFVGASTVDFAFGIENNTLWSSIPASGYQFKWYAGTTSIANLNGGGTFTAVSFTGAGTGLTGTAASLTAGAATTATNISGGSANQIHYQTGAGATSFITAPSNGTFLFYTTAGGFSWQASTAASVGTANIATYETVTTATTGTYYPALYSATSGNLPVNANSALNFNSATGALTATSFSGAGTGLTGTASSLSIGGSAGSATTATNIAGGAANQIHYQTGAGATSFITAPANGTFLFYTTAGGFSWTVASGASVGTANIATYETVTTATTGTWYPALYSATSGNLQVNANNALSFNSATGALSATSFTGAGTGLTGTASSLSIGGSAGSATTATNIAGGAANQIHYQTGAGATSFITAPANGTFLYYTTASGFQWTVATGASVGTANIANYEVVTNATTGTWYPALYSATSGNLPVNANNALSFNSATGALTATTHIGAHSGDGSALTSLNATNITTGTIGTARLGSGSATSSTYLRGDSTWATITSGTSVTLTNDTTGAVTLYPLLSSTTSGTLSLANTSSTKLSYVPSTGALTSNTVIVQQLPSSSVSSSVGSLQIGPATSFNDINTLMSAALNVNNYAQTILQNLSNGNNASADYIVNCDVNGTSIYGDYGINSSTYNQGGAFGDANGTFLYASGGTLSLGTLNAYSLKLGTNNSTVMTMYANTGTVFNTAAAGYFKFAPTVAPTTDMVQITNAGFPITTVGSSALQVDYYGSGAVESSASRVNMNAGNTSGGIWNAFRIAPNWAANTGVVQNGIKFDTIGTAGGGTDNMILANTGWDNILNYNGISLINGTGQINASQILTGTHPTATLGSGSATSSTYLRGDSTWATITSGTSVTLTNDTTGSTVLYPLLSSTTSGTLSLANTSSTKLSYVPSTGTLNTTALLTTSVSSLAATALSVDSGTTGALNIGTSASAKTITIGNSTGATAIVANSGTGGVIVNTVASGFLRVAPTAVPTTDMVQITNAGFPITTAGSSALQVDYYGGSSAIESSASRVNMNAGNTSGGIWNAFRIAPNWAAGPGVIQNGIKFDTIAVANTGTDNMILANTGWDNILNYNGISLINGTGQINASQILTGTVPSAVLGTSTLYIGTTAITLNRASSGLALTGITSIDGQSVSTNVSYYGVVTTATTGSYYIDLSPNLSGNNATFANNALSFNVSTGTLSTTTYSGSGASLSSLNASNLTSGTIATARLGSGTANANTYLAGNSTWQPIPVTVRQSFTATAGQTSFTVSGGYTPGVIDVYRNGSKLVNGTDVTITSGTSVVLAIGASSGDSIEVVGWNSVYSILGTITADNLTGTIPSPVLGNSTLYIGTTAIALNRTSASQALTGITSIDGSAASLVTTGNYQVGSLGIGTAASGVSGEIRAANNITAYYSSDINLKENIIKISNPINKVHQISGVMFDWKDFYIQERGGEDGFFVRKHDTGVIAQEIEQILPEIVVTRGDGYKAVNYEKLIPLLIESIKDQQTQIESLKDEVNILKERLK